MRLIDADALIDRLDYCVKEGMGSTIAFTFKHMVEEAPTIDIPHGDDWERYSERLWKNAYERGKADRPKGEWREEQNWRTASFYSVCSECGYFDDERDDLTAYNFCPYCGAEMKGADDEID